MSKRILPHYKENHSPIDAIHQSGQTHGSNTTQNLNASANNEEYLNGNSKKKYKSWGYDSIDCKQIEAFSTTDTAFRSPYTQESNFLKEKQQNNISMGDVPTESSVTSNDRLNSIAFECNESIDCVQKEDPCVSICQEYIATHILNEKKYTINPYYLEERQINVKKIMRTILFDWLMEVCAEYHMKRETYYLATNYIDRYLSLCDIIKKEVLQLIGVTCLMIASKIEEIWPPKVIDFVKITVDQYSISQIHSMELNILRSLKWQLYPPTVFMWSNMFMSQWDLFIESSFKKFNMKRAITFKHSNGDDFKRFREIMQIIDLSSLCIDTFQYNLRIVCLSALFLVLDKQYSESSDENNKPGASNIFCSIHKKSDFNEMFFEFAQDNWEICKEELTPCIGHMHQFTRLPILYDMPANTPKTDSYEDMITYQTHHPEQLEFVRQILANN